MQKLLAAAALFSGVFCGCASSMAGSGSGQNYMVRKGDTLGTIAERFYEDPFAYPTIVEGTNGKAEGDSSYKAIHNPHDIAPGQRLWIPASATAEAGDMEGHGVHKMAHWGYQGPDGPTSWGRLDKNFKLCDSGREQSPVSIPSGAKTVSGVLKFDYKPTGPHIVNNGHTIQVNYDPGSTLTIDGKAYSLAQFHFHVPSENTIDGVAAAMEMHLVHVSRDGRLAVIGVLFDIGESDNPFLGKFWGAMPPAIGERTLKEAINVAAAFEPGAAKYAFRGSLTTPPCSEQVKWYVMKKKATASKAQIAKFVSVIGLNARPAQPLFARKLGP